MTEPPNDEGLIVQVTLIGSNDSSPEGGRSVENTDKKKGTRNPISDNALLYISFILAWVAVNLWTRFLDNFLFETLGISPKSTVAAFVVAMAVSFLIIYFFFAEVK